MHISSRPPFVAPHSETPSSAKTRGTKRTLSIYDSPASAKTERSDGEGDSAIASPGLLMPTAPVSRSAPDPMDLLVEMLKNQATQDSDQMGLQVLHRCRELGGASMSDKDRTTVIRLITDGNWKCNADKAGMMMWGLCVALDIRSMGDAALEETFLQIVDACRTCAKEHTKNIFEEVGVALGGVLISGPNRRGLLVQIMKLRTESTPRILAMAIHGLAIGLGGRQMTDQMLGEFFNEVLLQPDWLDTEQIAQMALELTLALGGKSITEDKWRALQRLLSENSRSERASRLRSVAEGIGIALIDLTRSHTARASAFNRMMSDFFASNPKLVKFFIRGLGRGLGWREMSVDNCKALALAVLSLPKTGSLATLKELTGGLCEALADFAMTDANLTALLAQILALHGSFTPQQMGEMIGGLSGAKRSGIVVDAILRSDASTMKKWMMITSCLIGTKSNVIHLQWCKTRLADVGSVAALHPASTVLTQDHIDAALLAANGSIAGILQIKAIDMPKKLEFLDYVLTSLRHLSQNSAVAEFKKIIGLSLPPSLKSNTLSVILKAAPCNATLFSEARELLFERLSDMNTPENIDSPEFTALRDDINMLYDSFKQHMTTDFIAKEKEVVSDAFKVAKDENWALPDSIEKSIMDILDARKLDLTRAVLPTS